MGVHAGGFGQYCPISRAVEVLGERWSLLIVRDLLVGRTRFNDLARGNPGLSRSLLAKRLRQLERAGIVVRVDGEYLLTAAGDDLRAVVFGLGAWGARWQFGDPRDDGARPGAVAVVGARPARLLRVARPPGRARVRLPRGTPPVLDRQGHRRPVGVQPPSRLRRRRDRQGRTRRPLRGVARPPRPAERAARRVRRAARRTGADPSAPGRVPAQPSRRSRRRLRLSSWSSSPSTRSRTTRRRSGGRWPRRRCGRGRRCSTARADP